MPHFCPRQSMSKTPSHAKTNPRLVMWVPTVATADPTIPLHEKSTPVPEDFLITTEKFLSSSPPSPLPPPQRVVKGCCSDMLLTPWDVGDGVHHSQIVVFHRKVERTNTTCPLSLCDSL
jgi:hypothetical protein